MNAMQQAAMDRTGETGEIVFATPQEPSSISGGGRTALEIKLLAALLRLCKSYPTDTDMHEAGWEPPEINEGCAAYDEARNLLASLTPTGEAAP